MYDLMFTTRRLALAFSAVGLLSLMGLASTASAQINVAGDSVVRQIVGPSDKLEITTNSSRILTLGKKIPRVQVNNPELLTVTPLSATQVQVSAKEAGVTQVNLWDEDGGIHTVDVYIYGDVRELEYALQTQFPNSSIKVYRYSQSLVLTGFIDRPDYVDPIRQLAEDYAPKVINNISVGGVQQVLLKIKIYEVARNKLRELGVDIGTIGNHGYFGTSVSGLLNTIGSPGNPDGVPTIVQGTKVLTDTGGQTVEFLVTEGADGLVGLLDALDERRAAKILAEPNIVAVSGRPAQFNEGGEIPILVPQGLGNLAIEYKPYGTQVDFLPIVLGNGKIRLEVRPRISELDYANGIVLNDIQIPALTLRQVDTAVEMNAGQTFALAGLIQQRTETLSRGIPFLRDIPYFGVPFRRMEDDVNEIELLILVTPEFVDAMSPEEVPPCGPGMSTVSPSDKDLFLKGIMEVPNNCGPCGERSCGPACRSESGFGSQPPSFVNGPRMGGPQMHRPYMQGGQMMPSIMHEGAAPLPPELPTEMQSPGVEQIEAGPEMLDQNAASKGKEETSVMEVSRFQPAKTAKYVRQPVKAYQNGNQQSNDWNGSEGLIGPFGYDD